MKILITTFTYPPNKDGVAEACRSLAEGLVYLGWEVWVATSMASDLDFTGPMQLERNGVRVIHFKFVRVSRNRHKPLLGFDECRDFVKKGSFDVVVNQCWDTSISICLQSIAKETTARWVLVSHGYGAHMYVWQNRLTMGIGLWLRGVWFTMRRLPKMIRVYDHVVFLSHRKDFGRFFDHRLASWLCHPDIRIIANGVDLNCIPSSSGIFRKTYGIGEAPMALCVANFSERKNQGLAVRAFYEANVPDSVLVLIGSHFNEYARAVMDNEKQLRKSFPGCRVIFLEKLSREITSQAFAECDLFLLTAKAETQPIVLIEAMAASKPWISTDTGCARDMRGGIVCNSKILLVDTIRELLQNPEKRRVLGDEGRREAELNYDTRRNLRKFDDLFRKGLQKTP